MAIWGELSGLKTVKGESEAGDGAGLFWGRQDKMCGEETEPGGMGNNSL